MVWCLLKLTHQNINRFATTLWVKKNKKTRWEEVKWKETKTKRVQGNNCFKIQTKDTHFMQLKTIQESHLWNWGGAGLWGEWNESGFNLVSPFDFCPSLSRSGVKLTLVVVCMWLSSFSSKSLLSSLCSATYELVHLWKTSTSSTLIRAKQFTQHGHRLNNNWQNNCTGLLVCLCASVCL